MQSFIMNSLEVFIHIHHGSFAGTGAIVRLPQCQWSKTDGYGKFSQCITTTKHSIAKPVCIFLGIYCTGWIRRTYVGRGWYIRMKLLRRRLLIGSSMSGDVKQQSVTRTWPYLGRCSHRWNTPCGDCGIPISSQITSQATQVGVACDVICLEISVWPHASIFNESSDT